MKRHLWIASALAGLLCGCAEVVKLPPPNFSVTASSAAAQMLSADQTEELGGRPDRLMIADSAAKDAGLAGDLGAETLCLEQAYRASFLQSGVQRWDQERRREDIARRLRDIKEKEGRHGAAATYAVLAALSGSYLDSDQAAQDRQAWQQAQTQLAQEQARAEQAQEQADKQFVGNLLTTGVGTGLGLQSVQSGMMQSFQSGLDYAQQSGAIGEAEQGIAAKEGALDASTVNSAQDQVLRLMDVYLESAGEPALYAKEIKRALLREAPKQRGPALRHFLALDLRDSDSDDRRDFIVAFAAAQAELWAADADSAPAPLHPLAGSDYDAATWSDSSPESVGLSNFYVDIGYQSSSTRSIPGSAFYENGVGATPPKELPATVGAGPLLALTYENAPYPGPGLAWNFQWYGFGAPVTLQQAAAPASLHGVEYETGLRFGLDWDFADESRSALVPYLGLSTLLGQMGVTSVNPQTPAWYQGPSFDFMSADLSLVAGLRLWHLAKVGVQWTPVAPVLTTDTKDTASTLRVWLSIGWQYSPAWTQVPDSQ